MLGAVAGALPKILPVAGALLGGVEGYKRSGGDLGAAALGSGIGALGGGGLRMAGSALAGQALVANPMYKVLAERAAKGTLSAGDAQLLGALTKGAVPLATGVGALGLPLAGNLAGNIASGVKGGAGNAAQLGAGVIGYTADGAPVYNKIGGAALPPGMGQYGPTNPYGSPLDVYGIPGMGQRAETLKTAQTQRDVLRTLLPEIEAAAEARSKKEFERQMAAKGIRTNIDTRAAMQQRAQQAGLQAGLGALSQAGGALTSQYQYQ
jgi:hypothetical protein